MTRPLEFGQQARAGWRRQRLKDLASYVDRGVAPEYADGDTGVVAFNQKCVRPDLSIAPDLGRPVVNGSVLPSSPARLRAGDIVINSTGRGTLGRAGLVRTEPHCALVADGHVTIVRFRRDHVDLRFVSYILATEAFYQQANICLAVGATNQTELNREALRRMAIALPPLDEQWRIADYLDAETARIDELIAEQLSLTELLWERRRAAVFDAVTGRSIVGDRRPAVPWVDSIPADWRVSKLTGVARLGSGHTPARDRPEFWVDCTIPWITTGEVSQIRSDMQEALVETREKISALGVAHSSATVHPAGTVVLCRTAASAGFSAIMGKDMATSQDFATWTCGPDIEPSFLLYCLRAMRADLLGRLAMGSTHRTIYMPEVKSIAVPLPSVREQRRLVAELRRTFESLDETRKELAHQIDLLRERRQALITAAVTQGIDGLPGVA